MIKEYIMELKTENREKLNGLEKQMKDLLNDLDGAKEWMETLQTEKNVDTNIFSPRVIDTELEGKVEEAKNNIQKINQDIDYVKSFIEEGVAKDKEYEKLLEELEQTDGSDSERGKQDSEIQRHDPKGQKHDSEIQGQNLGVQGQSSEKQNQGSEKQKKSLEEQKPDSENQEQGSEVQKHDFEKQEQNSVIPGISRIPAKFLAELYKKTELCLDLLYNDRSRCKSELKNMKTMIKNVADSLHDQINS